jgi:hypothetical protein
MRPSIDDGLLLPNFIVELAETGRQVREIALRRMRAAEREGERFKRRKERYKKNLEHFNRRGFYYENRRKRDPISVSSLWNGTIGYIRKLASAAATANLAWQFAVRPTVDDAKKIMSLIETYSKRLTQLIEQAKKRQVRHYARPVDNALVLPTSVTSGLPGLYASTVHELARKSEWVFRPKYRASMLFTYDASALEGQLGKLRGLLHAFGVVRVASIIWEAIPFSFVVDWFVNVGDLIGNIEDQLLDPLPIVIHDFSHSLKYGYRTKFTWRWNNVRTDIAIQTREFYERRRDTPSLWDSLSVHTPNLNQAGLGLSLVIARMDGITNWKRR